MTMGTGALIGLISDELGLDIFVVADVHKNVFGMEAEPGKITADYLARFLVGICVKSCGASAMRAGNAARDQKAGLSAEMSNAIVQGRDFQFHLLGPTRSGLTVGAHISREALRRIAVAAGAVETDAAWPSEIAA